MNFLLIQKFLVCAILFLLSTPTLLAQTLPKQEFRATWIVTLKNIDFPSKGGLSVKEQKQEFTNLLDKLQKIGINAIIFQVRPAADAFYPSEYEPYSTWLTGEQGKNPEENFDFLAFAIDQTHERAIEFHAWFNPFRAVHNINRDKIHPAHITKQNLNWFFDYDNTKYFNAGIPEVRQYLTNIITDVLVRYDIDAIHFDDYFYPYPSAEKIPDFQTYQKYSNGENIGDWRRSNINQFIENIHLSIKQNKPKVKFGISPFPVWRTKYQNPLGMDTDGVTTCYEDLFADVRLWLEKGWVDYIIPQAYQHQFHKKIPYNKVMAWWNENSLGKHIYSGLGVYRFMSEEDARWKNKAELGNQIRFNRKNKHILGTTFYNTSTLLENRANFLDTLKQNLFANKAVVPPMKWLDHTPPLSPENLSLQNMPNGVALSWKKSPQASDLDTAFYYAVYRFHQTEKQHLDHSPNLIAIVPAHSNTFLDTQIKNSKDWIYNITAFDRLHNESLPLSSDEGVLVQVPMLEHSVGFVRIKNIYQIFKHNLEDFVENE